MVGATIVSNEVGSLALVDALAAGPDDYEAVMCRAFVSMIAC